MNCTDHAATDQSDQSAVLVIAADADAADHVTDALASHASALAVRTVADGGAARPLLSEADCVVVAGDAEVEAAGVDLLQSVRDADSTLPFVPVLREPSAATVGELLDAGATDVVETGTHPPLLATRIANAVARPRPDADSSSTASADSGATSASQSTRLSELKRRALDEAEIGIVISEADGDTETVFVNEGFERITGYDRDEFVGRNCRVLQGEETDDRPVRTMREAVREGNRSTVVLRNYRKDGTAFWNEVDINPVRDDEGTVTHFLGFQRDVTERKRLQQELVASQQSLRQLYAVTTDTSLSFEERVERTLAIGCERLDVGLGFVTRITDDTQNVVHAVGDHPLLQPGESCPLSRSYCRRTLDTEGLLAVVHAVEGDWQDDPAYETFGLECYLGGKVRVNGELYGTLCFADDEPRAEPFSESQAVFVELLTRWVGYELEQRRNERELRVAQRRFRSLFDNPMTFAGILDTDGTLREANDTARATLEDDVSVVGDRFWEAPWWPSEESRTTVRAAVERAADGDVAQFECDYVHVGGEGTVGVTVYPVYGVGDDDADGDRDTVVSLMAVGTDTTTRTEQAAQLQQQRDRLEEFASVVSHDLRSPLEVARGRLQLYEATGEEAHLESADDSLDRISTLIDDLLTLARQGDSVSDVESTRVTDVARQAWNTAATDTGRLVVDLDADTTVEADPSRLQQLFENLFRNSVEHGSTSPRSQAREDSVEHGSTGSRTAADDSDAPTHDTDVTVRLTPLEGTRGFAVEDDGPGIPSDVRDAVFERGYTTNDDGTGFGLAIVERIADAHGWSVRVEESDTGGARFEFGVDA